MEINMKQSTPSKPAHTKHSELSSYLLLIVGSLAFCIGVNLFITPLNLYNGGAVGIAQLIRTLLIDSLKLPIPNTIDISGILYLVLNIP